MENKRLGMLKNKFRQQDFKLENTVLAEYIWLGGNLELRGKTKVLHNCQGITNVNELECWNFDGSSTKQATGDNSEVFLKPQRIFKDPFRGAPHILVMCSTYQDLALTKPNRTNFRHFAEKIFAQKPEEDPWFGIEQEQCLMSLAQNRPWPLGFPSNGYGQPQGPQYCSVGGENSYGRDFSEALIFHCLDAGITVSGTNAEVLCGQWEIQIGPCHGIDMADQLWMTRQIMNRIAENFNIAVDLHPKPIKGDWNGSGAHTNYSTESTRNDTDLKNIQAQLENLKNHHMKSVLFYSPNNYERLSGAHETSAIGDFTQGIANRGASVRIPRVTGESGKGYYEDRRPASDIDPQMATASLQDITIMNCSPNLLAFIDFVQENAPYLCLTEAKLQHWANFKQESI